jgi:PAS domain S-box-containing protein
MIFRKKAFLSGTKGFDGALLDLNEQDNIQQRVKEQLLSTAFRQTPLAILAILINSIVLAYVEWNVINHKFIIVWLLIQSLTVVVRYNTFYFYQKYTSRRTYLQWESWFIVSVVFSSAAWSMTSSLFFLTEDIAYQSFLAIVLAGMVAGTVVSISYVLRAFKIYLALVLVPLIIALILQYDMIHSMMGIMITIFWIVISVTARRFHQNISNTFKSQLEYENAYQIMQLSDEHFETIFKEAPAGIFYYDNDLIVMNSNDEMMQILHIDREKMIGLDLKILPDTSLYPALSAPFGDHKGYYEGPYISMINKLQLWVTLRTSPIYDTKREVIGGIAIVSDITERIIAEEKIAHQAFYDALTDIPNRILLKDRIEQSLSHYRRHKSLIWLHLLGHRNDRISK